MPNDLVQEYLYRLKSAAKRSYAKNYAAWLERRIGAKPTRPEAVSPPAALAIRHTIEHLADRSPLGGHNGVEPCEW